MVSSNPDGLRGRRRLGCLPEQNVRLANVTVSRLAEFLKKETFELSQAPAESRLKRGRRSGSCMINGEFLIDPFDPLRYHE